KGIVQWGGQSTGLVKDTVLKSKQIRLVRDAVSCQWLHRIKLNVWVYHARGLGRKKVHWVPLSCQFIDDACRMANHPASLDARRHVSAQEKNTSGDRSVDHNPRSPSEGVQASLKNVLLHLPVKGGPHNSGKAQRRPPP